jgi:branched-chain amino acid transport system permease protein
VTRPNPLMLRAAPVVFVVVLTVLPLLLPGRFWPHILTMTVIFAILVLGQNIITGWCGMLTLGQAGFAGVGAYTSAILTMSYDVPWLVAFLCAGLLSAIVGALLALPCLRVKSDFLSLVTIAFNQMFFVVANNWMDVTRGPMGLTGVPSISIFGWVARGPAQQFWVMLAVAVLLFIAVGRLTRGATGRAWKMIRDDETAARSIGVDVTYYKVLAFAVGCALCGLGGSFYAHYLRLVSPDMFKLDDSLLLMQMAILGGLASLPGTILGTVLMIMIPESLRSTNELLIALRPGIAGVILLALMIWRPNGLLGAGGPPLFGAFSRFLREKLGLQPGASK